MPTCGKRALRKATGSNRFRQLCFRRIGNHMGMRVKLGEKLWGAFMKDIIERYCKRRCGILRL
jgi:hypothetical protein